MNRPVFDPNIEVKENEILSKHSTFRIGGEAAYAVFPKSKEELLSAINSIKSVGIKYKVIGYGSNILFDDKGFDGAIIFTKYMSEAEYIHRADQTLIRVECGRNLTELASDAGKKHSLTGLEFAYGIPGSIGGAIYMNAGAYGGEMSGIVVESEYYSTETDSFITIDAESHNFSYRHSFFADHPEYIVISTLLRLHKGDSEEIFNLMSKNMSSRREKQPLEYPNAGSTFKRPVGHFAGKLIEDAGLKGYTVGGAQVSEKHAGFFINRGGATCRDVLELMEYVKCEIKTKFNVELESEIIYIPY